MNCSICKDTKKLVGKGIYVRGIIIDCPRCKDLERLSTLNHLMYLTVDESAELERLNAKYNVHLILNDDE